MRSSRVLCIIFLVLCSVLVGEAGPFGAARAEVTQAIDLDQVVRCRIGGAPEATQAFRSGEPRRTRLRCSLAAGLRSGGCGSAQSAELAARWHKVMACRYRLHQAENLNALGGELADKTALIEAREICHSATDLVPRQERPGEWARLAATTEGAHADRTTSALAEISYPSPGYSAISRR